MDKHLFSKSDRISNMDKKGIKGIDNYNQVQYNRKFEYYCLTNIF